MRTRRVIWISALVLAASALAGVGAPLLIHADSGDTTGRTISVLGSGVVETTPDTATTSFGVTTQADTARDAISRNAAAMTKVIDALESAGIESNDLQTQFVSLNPQYDEQVQKIIGYTATNSVSAIVRDLAKVGDVIDTGVAAGANNVGGPSLAREDQDKLYRDALKEAVADARAKANALADAAGVSLGSIKTMVESPQESGPVVFSAIAKDSVGTPIEPGTSQITANVRVVFAVS